jgi:hypothetical protein
MTSIHSPTSEMVRLFSHMILLTTGGRLAYHGPMPTALAHFETLGYEPCYIYIHTKNHLVTCMIDYVDTAPERRHHRRSTELRHPTP